MNKSLFNNLPNTAITFLYVLYVIYWNITIANQLDFGDSVDYFSHQAVNWEFLISRYNTWSSRLIIESMLVFLSKHIYLFLLLNTIFMLVFPCILWKLFEYSKMLKHHFGIILLLIMLYEFNDMSSAGWIATLVNYYYPMVLGSMALLMLTTKREENFNVFLYIILNLCLLFACNMEQCCIALLPIFAYKMLTTKKFSYYSFPIIICVASLIFILTAPGNYSRFLSNQEYWLPDFINYTLEYKLYVGFQTTIMRYFFEITPLFTLLISLLLLGIYKKKKFSLELIPLIILLLLPVLDISDGLVLRILKTLDFPYFLNYGLFILSVFLFLLLLLILATCVENRRVAFVVIAIFLIGFGTRLMMGLSPSVFASSDRTFIFTDFGILLICFILIDNFWGSYPPPKKKLGKP